MITTYTVQTLLDCEVPMHCLPVSDPDAVIEVVDTRGTSFDYWFRHTDPITGETSETRGREPQ